MLSGLRSAVPPDALNIALVLALAFFVGLEREEHKQREASYAFGGIRTFPLIGLVSYALALLSAPRLVPWMIGFAVVGSFMLLSYQHKLAGATAAGLTTEISALATYVVGGLVQQEHYWLATAIGILAVLLLELKKGLEDLATRFASNEIVTVAKFLLLAAVILPVVPAREVTAFHINPFETWLVVVTVSGVSFASYAAERLLENRGGLTLSAILGGAYSSTVTTVVLARQAAEDQRPNLFAGSILTASAVMYARLVALLLIFDVRLGSALAPPFLALALVGVATGLVVSRRKDRHDARPRRRHESRNPLEIGSALLFAAIFVVVLVLTELVQRHVGPTGLYSLAAIMGVTDVDPFVLGLAQRGTEAASVAAAATAVVIAAASNNVIKALYAYGFADRATGRKAMILLLAFAVLGLGPLAWIAPA